ncbi:MAG: C_GCAxxG_C_C family protein [Clostridiales bacterium]|nr:C_GCAxxG_C_C family protein [Clostridiales bacterium]
MISKGEKAEALFMQGYNCSQAVASVFADEMNMRDTDVARLTMGFGGGMGRMREVCGAVSGMAFVISALYADEGRASVYEKIQTVAEKFEAENGSIVCRELLGLDKDGKRNPTPEPRTEQYYKKRPCNQLVHMAADIMEEFLNSK